MQPEWDGPFDRAQYPIRSYDVLSALLVMAEMGLVRDRRCRDALDPLDARCHLRIIEPIGDPVPDEHALHRDGQVLAVGGR